MIEAKHNNQIVAYSEENEVFEFEGSIIDDPNMSGPLIRDAARFFKMGVVKGRKLYPVYPVQENNDKPGIFAKVAIETGKALIKMRSFADNETMSAVDEVHPIFKYACRFTDEYVKAAMVVLSLMGHNEDMIFFLFLHMIDGEVWP